MFKALDESVWRTRRGLYRCTFACASDGDQSVQYGCVDQSSQRQGREIWFYFFDLISASGTDCFYILRFLYMAGYQSRHR